MVSDSKVSSEGGIVGEGISKRVVELSLMERVDIDMSIVELFFGFFIVVFSRGREDGEELGLNLTRG